MLIYSVCLLVRLTVEFSFPDAVKVDNRITEWRRTLTPGPVLLYKRVRGWNWGLMLGPRLGLGQAS